SGLIADAMHFGHNHRADHKRGIESLCEEPCGGSGVVVLGDQLVIRGRQGGVKGCSSSCPSRVAAPAGPRPVGSGSCLASWKGWERAGTVSAPQVSVFPSLRDTSCSGTGDRL